jgi:hypothetical protein
VLCWKGPYITPDLATSSENLVSSSWAQLATNRDPDSVSLSLRRLPEPGAWETSSQPALAKIPTIRLVEGSDWPSHRDNSRWVSAPWVTAKRARNREYETSAWSRSNASAARSKRAVSLWSS